MKHCVQTFLPIGLVTALVALLSAPRCFAQWTTDYYQNTPVCVLELVNPLSPAAVSDGMRGAIITWVLAGHVYAQRLDAMGVARWASNGIPICLTPGLQSPPAIVSDGAGGAIIAWVNMTLDGADTLLYAVMAQRVNGSGVPQWGANGDTVISIPRRTGIPGMGGGLPQRGGVRRLKAVSDGDGGAILLCYATFGSNAVCCIINRIDVGGGLPWGAGTNLLDTYTGVGEADMVSDCAGGAIVLWTFTRTEVGHIVVDRIDARGVRIWGEVPVTTGVFVRNAMSRAANSSC